MANMMNVATDDITHPWGMFLDGGLTGVVELVLDHEVVDLIQHVLSLIRLIT